MNGESVPSILRIPELARILGVTSEWLLTGDTKQSVITPATNTSNLLCLQKVILLESKIKQLEDSKLSPEHYTIINGMLDGINATIESWISPDA